MCQFIKNARYLTCYMMSVFHVVLCFFLKEKECIVALADQIYSQEAYHAVNSSSKLTLLLSFPGGYLKNKIVVFSFDFCA